MTTVVRSTMRIPCSGPEADMRSVSRGAAVGARLRSALQRSVRVDEDALVAAAVAVDPGGCVAAALQLREGLLRDAHLDGEHPAALDLRPPRRRRRPEVLDAGRLAGRLDVHAEVEEVDQDLRLSLRLHVRA